MSGSDAKSMEIPSTPVATKPVAPARATPMTPATETPMTPVAAKTSPIIPVAAAGSTNDELPNAPQILKRKWAAVDSKDSCCPIFMYDDLPEMPQLSGVTVGVVGAAITRKHVTFLLDTFKESKEKVDHLCDTIMFRDKTPLVPLFDVKNLKQGRLCLAKFGKKFWYRCVVCTDVADSEKAVKLYFIDFGNTGYITFDNIREFHPSLLEHHALAVPVTVMYMNCLWEFTKEHMVAHAERGDRIRVIFMKTLALPVQGDQEQGSEFAPNRPLYDVSLIYPIPPPGSRLKKGESWLGARRIIVDETDHGRAPRKRKGDALRKKPKEGEKTPEEIAKIREELRLARAKEIEEVLAPDVAEARRINEVWRQWEKDRAAGVQFQGDIEKVEAVAAAVAAIKLAALTKITQLAAVAKVSASPSAPKVVELDGVGPSAKITAPKVVEVGPSPKVAQVAPSVVTNIQEEQGIDGAVTKQNVPTMEIMMKKILELEKSNEELGEGMKNIKISLGHPLNHEKLQEALMSCLKTKDELISEALKELYDVRAANAGPGKSKGDN